MSRGGWGEGWALQPLGCVGGRLGLGPELPSGSSRSLGSPLAVPVTSIVRDLVSMAVWEGRVPHVCWVRGGSPDPPEWPEGCAIGAEGILALAGGAHGRGRKTGFLSEAAER